MAAALGQVFTPAPVADLAIALAVGPGLGDRAAALRLLDPACGDGVFLARAAERGLRVTGVEIDPVAAGTAKSRGFNDIAIADFLTLEPPAVPFDAVVGNPPYVRQELVGAAKRRIAARIDADWPKGARVAWSNRADLAMAFVARAVRFVKPGGRVAFVVSAALLEAGYGDLLGGFLAGRGRVAAVVASPRERWFRDAAVHGVLLVLERDPEPRPAMCARLRMPIAACAARVDGLADLAAVADIRWAAPGDALAPRLRAPDVWLAAEADVPLCPLGSLAEVRRGATSGANAFFYLGRAAAARAGLEPSVLRPVLRSPRTARRIDVVAAELPTVAFVAAAARHRLPAGARAYVDAHAALAARPTLAARDRFWVLPVRPARLFLTKAYGSRFVQPLTDEPVVPDQRFYAVRPRRDVPLDLLAAVLNGTLTALALEALGRASLGDGALEVSVGDAARLPVLDPRGLDGPAVLRAFREVAGRTMGGVAAEAVAADRRALDEALASRLPGLRRIVGELGAALAAATEERLVRSRGRIDRSLP